MSYEKGIDFSDLAVRYGDEFFLSRAALEKLVGMKLFPTQESNVPQVDHAPLNVVVGDLAVPQEELPTPTEPESVSNQQVKKKYKALPLASFGIVQLPLPRRLFLNRFAKRSVRSTFPMMYFRKSVLSQI